MSIGPASGSVAEYLVMRRIRKPIVLIQKRDDVKMMPLLVVFMAVMLNIIGAVVLKELAMREVLSKPGLVLGIGSVILLNGLRFLVWGLAHSRYPLNVTYPFTSLFFPFLLVVSLYYNEPLPWTKWVGTMLITVGVFWLVWNREQ